MLLEKKFVTIKRLYIQFGIRGVWKGVWNKLCGRNLLYGLHMSEVYGQNNSQIYQAPSVQIDLPLDTEYVQWLIPIFEKNGVINDDMIRFHRTSSFSEQRIAGKRILLISHELSRTGAPVVVLETAKMLKEAGFFVAVMAPLFQNNSMMSLKKDFFEAGIPLIADAHLSDYRWTYKSDVPEIISSVLDFLLDHIDLMICNSFTTHNIINCYNGKDIPILWWLHEGEDTYAGKNSLFFPRNLSDNIRIVCGGKFAQDILERYGIQCKSEVLLFGVPDTANSFSAILKNEKRRFILPGTICQRKNQKLLLEAIKLLSEEETDNAEFVLIGNAADEVTSKELTKETDNLPCVSIMQAVPNEVLLSIIQQADGVILPSLEDTMPVVLIDGLMYSKIVICSYQTGVSSFITNGKNGFVFDCHDAEGLASILHTVINADRSDLSHIGTEGRKIYDDLFSMDTFRKHLLGIINEEIYPPLK